MPLSMNPTCGVVVNSSRTARATTSALAFMIVRKWSVSLAGFRSAGSPGGGAVAATCRAVAVSANRNGTSVTDLGMPSRTIRSR